MISDVNFTVSGDLQTAIQSEKGYFMECEYKGWTKRFWTALKADAGKSVLRFDRFEDGQVVLEMVGTVEGRGVLLRWLSSQHGVVTVREAPYDTPEVPLDGEQTFISAQDDPAVRAAHTRQRVLALA